MYKDFWNEQLVIRKTSNGHVVTNCPICGEDGGHFYANIETGLWDCKKCQVSGNAWSFLRDYKQMGNNEILQYLYKYGIKLNEQTAQHKNLSLKVFDKMAVENYSSQLTEEKLIDFSNERGLSVEILKKHKLGFNDYGEFTLPIEDDKGRIRNILRKKLGESTISSKNGEAILFGLEDLLLQDKKIFIVEGPWSAMALKERGYKAVGTCGAGILKEEQVALFKDKEVFIIPDNDEAGKKGASAIVQKLKDVAKYVCVINLPVPEKKDIRDFFKDGGTVEQFENLINETKLARLSQYPLCLIDFLKKDIPPVEYYVMDIIQKKGKVMISAAPNVGKSIFVQNMALDISSSKAQFMDKFAVSPARVLYLDLEMGESALKDRFQKMAKSESLENFYVKYIPSLDLLNDESKKLIESWISELKIEVLILDPLGNAWSGDESKQELVGKLTSYLNTLLERYGISILVVHHWRKATKDNKTGGQMAAGSYKWEAWVDCHITLESKTNGIAISCHKNRNRPKFRSFLTKINPENLCFEFVTDFQKHFGEASLETLFDGLGKDKASIPELIKFSKKQGGPSATVVRKLINETTIFDVDTSGKTHYLRKKAIQENFLEHPEEINWQE